MSSVLSIGSPDGPSASTCGYCSPAGQRSVDKSSYHTCSLHAMQLSCEVYQKMIDRGWRRSGTYCYKPDLRRSCCPQYTIKLDALAFEPSRSQRKLVNRWNRFILRGENNGSNSMEADAPKHKQALDKSSGYSLTASIHASEATLIPDQNPVHRFEVALEISSYSDEKYALYQRYQLEIHHDLHSSSSGFKGFLVDSPLRGEPIAYSSSPPEHLPTHYGSYHQTYRLDGQLIAVGVLDILPNCVSSVYFMYDKSWERFSLGKLSALREASLAREIHNAGASRMTSLYMGFYIHSCQKMRYKGDYAPSYLADPETYEWYPLRTCIEQLDKCRYACFSTPDHSIDITSPPLQESYKFDIPDADLLAQIMIVNSVSNGTVSVMQAPMSSQWDSEESRSDILACVHGLGTVLSQHVILYL